MCNHRLNLARIFFIRSIRLVRESMDKIACVFLLAMKNRFDRYMAHAFPWRIGQNLKSSEEQLKKVMNFTFSGKFLRLDPFRPRFNCVPVFSIARPYHKPPRHLMARQRFDSGRVNYQLCHYHSINLINPNKS